MAVFSRYKKVLETDGSPMRVRTALALINQGLDEVLSELESEFDPDTRWALAWFEQHQFDEGLYGEAEVLATAKALSISHLAEAGIFHSRAGKVRLLRREELPEDWDPSAVGRLTVWEVTQHLIRQPRPEGREGNGESEGEDRRNGRDRPRPRLPALHALRAQGLGGRGGLLQQPRGGVAVNGVGSI